VRRANSQAKLLEEGLFVGHSGADIVWCTDGRALTRGACEERRNDDVTLLCTRSAKGREERERVADCQRVQRRPRRASPRRTQLSQS